MSPAREQRTGIAIRVVGRGGVAGGTSGEVRADTVVKLEPVSKGSARILIAYFS